MNRILTLSCCNERILALRLEAKRLEEGATNPSKGHFNAENTWVRRNYWLGVPATVSERSRERL